MEESSPARLSEVHRRLQAVRALLDEADGAGVVLGLRRNFAWLTGGGANHVVVASEDGAASILVTRDETVVLAPVNEAARIEAEELAGLPIEVAPVPWHEPDALEDEARRRTPGSLLDEMALEPELARLRSQLSPFDHHRLMAIAVGACQAMAQTLDTLQPMDTEDQAAGRLLGALAAMGLRAPVLLAAADERITRYRHPLPTATPVRQRLMIVLVAERWGLHVALTRSRAFEPPSAELARRMDAVETIQESMHRATRATSTLGDVMAAARLAYEASGFPDEWHLHHQGGVIGYQPRERIAVPGDPTPIRPGMAFAWNPSISGAKAEETVLLTTDDRLVIMTTSVSTAPDR
ncbi:MAG: M24 family metallopeptidase [Candidatus Limnocylindria bacterium]